MPPSKLLFSLPLITIASNEPWNRNTKRIEIPQSQAMTLGAFHVLEIFGNFSLRKHPFLHALRRRAKRPQRRRARRNGCFRRLRKFRFGGKWKTFRRFFPLENSLKKWKIYKGRSVFRCFERNFLFHLHVSRGFYQFQLLPTRQPSWCPIG